MDARTRAATYEDVLRIAELLEEEHIEYTLIGGYALCAPRHRPLDGRRRHPRRAVARQRAPLGSRALEAPRSCRPRARRRRLHAEPYAIRINDEFTIDVMNSASGFSWHELLPYRTRVEAFRCCRSRACFA